MKISEIKSCMNSPRLPEKFIQKFCAVVSKVALAAIFLNILLNDYSVI